MPLCWIPVSITALLWYETLFELFNIFMDTQWFIFYFLFLPKPLESYGTHGWFVTYQATILTILTSIPWWNNRPFNFNHATHAHNHKSTHSCCPFLIFLANLICTHTKLLINLLRQSSHDTTTISFPTFEGRFIHVTKGHEKKWFMVSHGHSRRSRDHDREKLTSLS